MREAANRFAELVGVRDRVVEAGHLILLDE
jgi:hypothetical protein